MSQKLRYLLIFVLLLLLSSGCSFFKTDTFPPTITPESEIPTPAPQPSSTPPASTEVPIPDLTVSTPAPVVIITDGLIPFLTPGQDLTISFVHMVNATEGWAVGNAGDNCDHILRTDDGGNTWWDTSPPESVPESADETKQAEVYFLDLENAWVSYQPYSNVWRTVDGGRTWQPATTGESVYLGATLMFADEDNGWLMKSHDAAMHHEYVSLYRTTSGGTYWEEIFGPTTSDELQSFSKTGMVFVDSNHGWVSRDSGGVKPGAFIDTTTDGGATWQSINLPPPNDNPDKFNDEYCSMRSPTLFSTSSGALVVTCKRYDDDEKVITHYLFSTADGGQTWNRADYPGGELQFISRNIAYALGRDIHKSLNGGQTWTDIPPVDWYGQFSFVNENLAWAVAQSEQEFALMKTIDGCNTWAEIQHQIITTDLPPRSVETGPSIIRPISDESEQIAFISYRGTNDNDISDIYLMNIDGSGLLKITDSSGHIEGFCWSPDGQRITFDTNRDGNGEIYLINVDGTGLYRMTTITHWDGDPSWSPDGSRIAFTSSRDGDTTIYVMNVDGSNVQKLIKGRNPAWSPDGSEIAFAVFFEGIYMINADGSNVRKLTDSSEHGFDWYPAWSPDGSRILFASNRHSPGDALTDLVYIVNYDGSGIGQLTFSGWGMPPWAWSPDGSRIAYSKGFYTHAKLFIMDANGTNQTPLMEDNEGLHPLWRPPHDE